MQKKTQKKQKIHNVAPSESLPVENEILTNSSTMNNAEQEALLRFNLSKSFSLGNGGTKSTYGTPKFQFTEWCKLQHYENNHVTEAKLLRFLKEEVIDREAKKRGRKRKTGEVNVESQNTQAAETDVGIPVDNDAAENDDDNDANNDDNQVGHGGEISSLIQEEEEEEEEEGLNEITIVTDEVTFENPEDIHETDIKERIHQIPKSRKEKGASAKKIKPIEKVRKMVGERTVNNVITALTALWNEQKCQGVIPGDSPTPRTDLVGKLHLEVKRNVVKRNNADFIDRGIGSINDVIDEGMTSQLYYELWNENTPEALRTLADIGLCGAFIARGQITRNLQMSNFGVGYYKDEGPTGAYVFQCSFR